MNTTRVILGSLALDLRRVAQSYYRGSEGVARTFVKEALTRKAELKLQNVKPYIRKLVAQMPNMLSQKDHKRIAEDALMYSVLFQNAATGL